MGMGKLTGFGLSDDEFKRKEQEDKDVVSKFRKDFGLLTDEEQLKKWYELFKEEGGIHGKWYPIDKVASVLGTDVGILRLYSISIQYKNLRYPIRIEEEKDYVRFIETKGEPEE